MVVIVALRQPCFCLLVCVLCIYLFSHTTSHSTTSTTIITMGDAAIHALAGAVGGSVSMALTYPLVNLSTRAAVATKKENISTLEALKKTLKTEGLAGLYSGLGSSLFGIALTQGTYYGTCALFKAASSRSKRSRSPWNLIYQEILIFSRLRGDALHNHSPPQGRRRQRTLHRRGHHRGHGCG